MLISPKTKRAKYGPEDKTIMAGLRWLALQHREARDHIIKIDNEGKRSAFGHNKARLCGLHTGASDLLLAFPCRNFCGLWVEVKPDGWTKPRNAQEAKRVEKQLAFGEKMKQAGYQFVFAKGTDELIKAFADYLNES